MKGVVYEINTPNFKLQAIDDLIFGWCIIIVGEDGFRPITPQYFTESNLDLLFSLFNTPLYPEELKQHILTQRDLARKKEKEAVPG